MKSIFLAVIAFAFHWCTVCAQSAELLATPRPGSIEVLSNPKYFSSSFAVGPVVYRDFATSPLFYGGSALSLNLGWTKAQKKGQRQWNVRTSIASANARVPETEFKQSKYSSIFSSSDISYQFLAPTPKLNRGKWAFHAGGVWMNTFNFHLNQSLGNSAAGIEAFIHLMGSGKVTYDMSHQKTGTRKVLFFFHREQHPQRQFLSFQLNAGILNWNYRPDYAYKELPEVDGTKLNPFKLVTNGSAWALNGYRVGTQLNFIRTKESGNAVEWSYLWDVLSAPGRADKFQMAAHRIQCTLYFNRN